jgi:hypothetical protein
LFLLLAYLWAGTTEEFMTNSGGKAMAQADIENFLIEERKKSDKWFTIHEIKIALSNKGLSNGCIKGVADDLMRLCSFKRIDYRGVGLWEHHKEFRAFDMK